MKIIKPEDSINVTDKCVVSIGNFDGIHKGHKIIIDTVLQRASKLGAKSLIVTFIPHTRSTLTPGHFQPLLTDFDEKTLLLEKYGIDLLSYMHFNDAHAQMPPLKFIKEVLIRRFKAVEWVMGENHTFGRNKEGTINLLRNLTGINHFNVLIAGLQTEESDVISSTKIRACIVEEKIDEAVIMLGHPYLIVAQRIKGVKKGSELGFPTINFARPIPEKVLPPAGVYAAELEFEEKLLQGALYFGNCPTFGNRDFHFEFHSLSNVAYSPDISGKAALWVHSFIRKDQKFNSTKELSNQMEKDINLINQYFLQE